jgi:hypothetical protein
MGLQWLNNNKKISRPLEGSVPAKYIVHYRSIEMKNYLKNTGKPLAANGVPGKQMSFTDQSPHGGLL